MTLTDPREDLAEQSSFVGYLMGLAGLAQVVHTLGAPDAGCRADPPREADDFVHVLLGVASLGQEIEGLVEAVGMQQNHAATPPQPASAGTRWLR
jgi:hypothetical protein